ncbi:DUF4352 domain-containing protein [Mycobacterium sp. C31M]
MTTPPTTAGWYPDPEGSGGQRYWDGSEWQAHGPEDDLAETSAWPIELPPWPEDDMAMPSWEDAGKAEPVVEEPVVEVIEAEEPIVDEPVAEVVEAQEPVAEADASPDVSPDVSEQTTTVVQLPEQPTAVVQLPEATAPEQPTAVVPTLPPPPASFAAPPPPVAESPAAGSPLKGYLIGVGALLAVLIGVLVWAFAFADPGTGATTADGTGVTVETSEAGEPTAATTDSAAPGSTAAPAAGSAVDGDVTITQNGVEITPTVSAVDNEFLTKTAAGQFVVVKLNLVNNGDSPATFLSDQQVLTAGGQPFNADTEGTFYLGGISAVLYPGEPVDVTIAFDVPAGSTPESIQVFGDLGSQGATINLT